MKSQFGATPTVQEQAALDAEAVVEQAQPVAPPAPSPSPPGVTKMRGSVTFDDTAGTYRVLIFYDFGDGRSIEVPPEGGDQSALTAHAVAARGANAVWDGTDIDAIHGTVPRTWPSTPPDPPDGVPVP